MGQELDGWFQEPVLQCHFPWVIIFSMSDKESKEEIHMVEINRNACTGCGQCMSDCIANNLFLREGKAEVSGNCILCGHCVAVCPLNAVSIPEYDMGDVEELSQEQAGLDSDRLLFEPSHAAPVQTEACQLRGPGYAVAGRTVYSHSQEYAGLPLYLCPEGAGNLKNSYLGRNRPYSGQPCSGAGPGIPGLL